MSSTLPMYTELHHLELVVYDFGSAHILVPSTNSHFFRPLRKKVLNLAPVHYMPDEVPVRVAQVSVVHCKLIEVCQRCSMEF